MATKKSIHLISSAKRFLNTIKPTTSFTTRSVHGAVYDKNPDDQLRGTVVPDDVIGHQPEKYWGPHPQTGVFGPSADHKPIAGLHTSAAKGGENSILDQPAFFRPQADLDKSSI